MGEQIFCGMSAPLSPTLSPDNSDHQLYWSHETIDGVLNHVADAMYLWDSQGRILSAVAKCDDGIMKRYVPSETERLHHSFHKLVKSHTLYRKTKTKTKKQDTYLRLFLNNKRIENHSFCSFIFKASGT